LFDFVIVLHGQSLIIVVAHRLVGLPFARAAKFTKGKACASPIQIFRQRQYGNHQSYLRGDGVERFALEVRGVRGLWKQCRADKT
jgi:hypothetical protein